MSRYTIAAVIQEQLLHKMDAASGTEGEPPAPHDNQLGAAMDLDSYADYIRSEPFKALVAASLEDAAKDLNEEAAKMRKDFPNYVGGARKTKRRRTYRRHRTFRN
jgi:hypothetical protein